MNLKITFGIGVGVLLWAVVYAPTGPGASFSETPFFRLWTRKCVCVCVCDYSWHLIFLIFAVSFFFLHFPSDAIFSSIHARTSFSGARRCGCSIVSWGLTTAGTPTARCARDGRIDSLITLRHWCWKTHGSNPIVSLEGMSQTGFLAAK